MICWRRTVTGPLRAVRKRLLEVLPSPFADDYLHEYRVLPMHIVEQNETYKPEDLIMQRIFIRGYVHEVGPEYRKDFVVQIS